MIIIVKWHYLALTKLSGSLRVVTLKHDGEFYCLKGFHSCSTKDYKKHYNVCKNHDYCYVEMPKEDNKIFYIKSCRKVHESSIYYLCCLYLTK